jgi:hypothetical protein
MDGTSLKKNLVVVFAIGALAMTGCGGSPKEPPAQQSPIVKSDNYVKSVRDATTTFKDRSDVLIYGIGKGGCTDLREGMTKDAAVQKATKAAETPEETKDWTTAFNMGIDVFCPEFG